jgi:flagellar biosynthetic protein FlhB
MADDPHEDRTEAATPRRLQKAREEGHAPVSRELTNLVSLAAVTLALVLAGPAATRHLAVQLSVFMARAHDLMPGRATAWSAGLAWVEAAAAFVLAALFAGAACTLVQTRFLLSGHGLRPDLSRIDPARGVRRLFGMDSVIEAGKALAKVALLALVLWQTVRSELPGLMSALFAGPEQILRRAAAPVLHVLLAVLAVQAAIAVLDYGWVTLRHARSLRMSRHDILEEQKETEGDPRVKARLRQIRTVRARRRMLAAVPKATVVVTNPTHYAVALAYDRATHVAPRVVAKGVDTLAARIRELAEANHIPVVANPPLAQALYRVELDTEIPAEHYQAVAEIIAYVWRLGRPRPAAAVVPESAGGVWRSGGT